MNELPTYSRAERHKKRRKNKRKVLFFAGLAVVFCVILFSLIVFGNKEGTATQETSDKTDELETKIVKSDDDEGEDPINSIDVGDTVEAIDEEDKEKVEIEEIESQDSNVIKAYEGDWKPIGTEQVGPHTTNYNDGSDDRAEIKKAVAAVTGIEEDKMIEHWVGNGGDQKVISTVQDEANDDIYRVYLEWIDEDGWQVKKVEKIHTFNSASNGAEEEGQEEEG